MSTDDINEISNVIQKLSVKYYGDDSCIWFGSVKSNDDGTYLIDIKFKEDFILKLQASDFARFRGEVYIAVDKIFSRNGCGSYITCKSGCRGCQDRAYKIQFSEEV